MKSGNYNSPFQVLIILIIITVLPYHTGKNFQDNVK